MGRVGADAAAWHERELVACGVRPLLVVDPQAPTGTVICLVDQGASAERTFLTDSGASLRLDPDDWSPALLDGVARLHLSGYLFFSEPSRALVSVALESARARGVPVSLDPASAGFLTELGADRFLALAEGVDLLLPSRDEAFLLTGLPNPADAAAKLSRHVPGRQRSRVPTGPWWPARAPYGPMSPQYRGPSRHHGRRRRLHRGVPRRPSRGRRARGGGGGGVQGGGDGGGAGRGQARGGAGPVVALLSSRPRSSARSPDPWSRRPRWPGDGRCPRRWRFPP